MWRQCDTRITIDVALVVVVVVVVVDVDVVVAVVVGADVGVDGDIDVVVDVDVVVAVDVDVAVAVDVVVAVAVDVVVAVAVVGAGVIANVVADVVAVADVFLFHFYGSRGMAHEFSLFIFSFSFPDFSHPLPFFFSSSFCEPFPGEYSLLLQLEPFVLQAMPLVPRPVFHLTCCIAVPYCFAASALFAANAQTYLWQRCPAVSTLLHVHESCWYHCLSNRNLLSTIAVIFPVHESCSIHCQ